MSREIDRKEILTELKELAFCRANDAVKLALLQGAGPRDIARLDLRGVESIHTAGNGGMEIKLVDRERLIALLLAATEEQPDPAAAAAGLIGAINASAEKLGAADEAGGTDA